MVPSITCLLTDVNTRAGQPAAISGAAHRWRILGAALLVQVTISIVTLGFPALVPFARSDLGLSRAEVGLFATVQSVGTMVALLPAGWAVDTLGERRVLVFGGIATCGLAILAAFAPSFLILLPLLILIGFASATPTPAGSSAIISAFSLRDRGFVMSIRQTGVPLGGAIAAVVLPPVALIAGWREALILAGVLTAAGAITARFLMPLTASPAARSRLGAGLRSIRYVATHDATVVGIAGIFLALGQFALLSYIALYLVETWHMSVATGSLFLVAANVGGVAGRLLWGTISDRLFNGVRRTPLIAASLGAVAGFVILAWLPPATPGVVLMILVLLLGATVIGWNGIYITLLSEIASPEMRGRSVAYGMTLTQVGIFGGPPLFGLLVDLTHSYRIGWLAVGAALLVAAAIVARVREGRIADVRTPVEVK